MRYCPERAFPPYPFLPGRDPHPTRDPKGHSYGAAEVEAAYLRADDWRDNDEYRFGADLYNHGFLWEAHETWEGLWHAAKKDDLQADHLQGLIQCAAACLKIRMEQPRGVTRLCELGTKRLDRVAREAGSPYMGLDLVGFVAALRAFVQTEPTSIDDRPRIELDG